MCNEFENMVNDSENIVNDSENSIKIGRKSTSIFMSVLEALHLKSQHRAHVEITPISSTKICTSYI
jgi:hypothetical protein